MLALGLGNDQRELDLVQIGDGLEHFKRGVPFPGLHLAHVSRITADFMRDVRAAPSLLQPQRGDHRAQRLLGCVTSALELFRDFAGHAGIIGD